MLSIKWIQSPDYYLTRTVRKRRRRRRRGDDYDDDDFTGDEPPILLSSPDYYFQPGEPPGQWWGEGSRTLGLVGEVTADALKQLFEGFSPDGKPLVQNAGAARRQRAWDLTFSAPKSVGVFWSQADKVTRRRILQLHFEAVQESLEYLQEVAVFTRRGKQGKKLEKAHLVVATFEHGCSRELDPQPHTHCLVVNVATRDDGTTGTILSKPLYNHKLTAGAIYRASYDVKLQAEFGLRTERDGTSFKLVGVPDDLCEEQSKRRKQIKKQLKTLGFHTAKAAALATLATRQAKEIPPPREQLIAAWQKVNAEYGFTSKKANKLLGRSRPVQVTRELAAARREALNGILDSQAHFSEQELIRATAIEAQGRGIPVPEILRAVRGSLGEDEQVIRLGTRKGEVRYTTREMFELERAMLASIEQGKENAEHVLSAKHVTRILNRRLPILTTQSEDARKRNSEQRQAVEHLTLKPGQIQVAEGMAGTGKTHMLGICREAWEGRGYRVTGMALAGETARRLQRDSGIESDSVAMRLSQLDVVGNFVRHHKRQLSRLVRGKSTHVWGTDFYLDSRTIVVLDEAGMVATRQMTKLIEHIKRRGAKLVLVGDRLQLQPIEAGGPLHGIVKRVGRVELRHIVRQEIAAHDPNPEWARQAVHYFAEGKAHQALKLFAERGKVSVADDREQAMLNLVRDWSLQGIRRPAQNAILAASNAEVERLNQLCQEARLSTLASTPKSIRVEPYYLAEGDRVLFTRKSRLLGLENGDRGVLVGINRLRKVLAVKLDYDQRTVFVPLKEYQDVRLGYATTVHKAQGATFENAFILAGGKMQDLHLSYVQSSRAKESTRFYTDRLEAGPDLLHLAKQMSRSHAKDLAHDVLGSEQSGKPDDKPGNVAKPPGQANSTGVQIRVNENGPVSQKPLAAQPGQTGDSDLRIVRENAKQFLSSVRERRLKKSQPPVTPKPPLQEQLATLRVSKPQSLNASPPPAASQSPRAELADKSQQAKELLNSIRQRRLQKLQAEAKPSRTAEVSSPQPQPTKPQPQAKSKSTKSRKSPAKSLPPFRAKPAVVEPAKQESIASKGEQATSPKSQALPPPVPARSPHGDKVAVGRESERTTPKSTTTPQSSTPVRPPAQPGKSRIDLSHLAKEIMTAPQYLLAVIKRYGKLPGGIVVEGEATIPIPLRSLQISHEQPSHLVVNDAYHFDTRLNAEEVACLWHAICESDGNDNFGALSQDEVVGMEHDTCVADAFRRADSFAGGIIYGYNPQCDVTVSPVDGYVNPFVAEAKKVREWDGAHIKTFAGNLLEGVVPQGLFCFSSACFRANPDKTITVSTAALTAAVAALGPSGEVVGDDHTFAARFPLNYAAMNHFMRYFSQYAAIESELARCSAYAELVQLLRLGKEQHAKLTPHESVHQQYANRQRRPSPAHRYTSCTAEFRRIARETAESVEQRLAKGLVQGPEHLIANLVGLKYAQLAAEARLVAKFKPPVVQTSITGRADVPPQFDPSAIWNWPHDFLIHGCLQAARCHPPASMEARRYLETTTELCRTALDGANADPATICSYVEARCSLEPNYNPLPDLKRTLTEVRFSSFEFGMMPFWTLTRINVARKYPELTFGDDREIADAIKRCETALGFQQLNSSGLKYYHDLPKWLSPRERLRFLNTLRRRGSTLVGFGRAVEAAGRCQLKTIEAALAVRRMRAVRLQGFDPIFLREDNPWFLSYTLLAELPQAQQERWMKRLEAKLTTGPGGKAADWWTQFKKSCGKRLDIPLLLAQELLLRGNTLDDLFQEMQCSKVTNPQEALFWLDVRDGDRGQQDKRVPANKAKDAGQQVWQAMKKIGNAFGWHFS